MKRKCIFAAITRPSIDMKDKIEKWATKRKNENPNRNTRENNAGSVVLVWTNSFTLLKPNRSHFIQWLCTHSKSRIFASFHWLGLLLRFFPSFCCYCVHRMCAYTFYKYFLPVFPIFSSRFIWKIDDKPSRSSIYVAFTCFNIRIHIASPLPPGNNTIIKILSAFIRWMPKSKERKNEMDGMQAITVNTRRERQNGKKKIFLLHFSELFA